MQNSFNEIRLNYFIFFGNVFFVVFLFLVGVNGWSAPRFFLLLFLLIVGAYVIHHILQALFQ